MKTSFIGYPRIGVARELKFAVEKYLRSEIAASALHQTAAELRANHWSIAKQYGIDHIPSNDFSFYDGVLDTAVLFNIIPERYQALQLSPLDTYFAMARGYQGAQGDVKALSMQKWFNTNYHYMVPEIEDTTEIRLTGTKLFDEYLEAKNLQIETRPVLTGAFTLLKLAKFTGQKNANDVIPAIVASYREVLEKLDKLGAEWIQLDEPALVQDLTPQDLELFTELYERILPAKGSLNVLLQTYFGDVRDAYESIQTLAFDGVGIDFVEGKRSLSLLKEYGFAADKVLFAGVINGKNIWRNEYEQTAQLIQELKNEAAHIVLNTSCSLLHVPHTVKSENRLAADSIRYLAFAEEKLEELSDLGRIVSLDNPNTDERYVSNTELFARPRYVKNESINERISALTDDDFVRQPSFTERVKIQKEKFKLPPLPTTTIGSFPQTADVRANRAALRKQTITDVEYEAFIYNKIAECVKRQEAIGLDVIVHGEYERNDMVEYFGECLDGFLFTEKAWVQSYGTRCVKPPIIWGDVSRSKSITVEHSLLAKSLTDKPLKGMLTGPVTILNWSFAREDISLQEISYQLALAIREEVLDLEANGIEIIQIDEAALREKLPLRRSDWHDDYLSWAIPSFRLVHSGVQAGTQIHTHMCYSQFSDIITEIDAMDADVITFEASRSDLAVVDAIHESNFETEVGPGVYDIHSPRVPSVKEIKQGIHRILQKVDPEKLWINPDCGLKTRGESETWASLENLVQAVQEIRAERLKLQP